MILNVCFLQYMGVCKDKKSFSPSAADMLESDEVSWGTDDLAQIFISRPLIHLETGLSLCQWQCSCRVS